MTAAGTTELPANDAVLAGLLLAVDPHGLGGVVLRGFGGPVRERWLKSVKTLLGSASPWTRVPVNVAEERLLGGLDFAATIASARPVFATGLLEAADGGALVLSMAERLPPTVAAIIGTTLDRGAIQVERDGTTRVCDAKFGIVALDEGLDDESIPDILQERLALFVSLDAVELAELDFSAWHADAIADARLRLGDVRVEHHLLEQICRTALAFGIPSLRAELLTLRAAAATAALRGSDSIDAEDVERAARLVLPQRARRLPVEPQDETEDTARDDKTDAADDATDSGEPGALPEDVLVDAVRAAVPPGLLAMLNDPGSRQRRQVTGGRAGPQLRSRRRGRPIGVKPTDALRGDRLNVLATLKAAAPWQRLRSQDDRPTAGLIRIRKEDLHVTRYKDRIETTTVFVVDASGSQAAQRLAEVKGAVELLLNDCYVRRDQVALIAFRRTAADVLLPPTRALARARRSLASLPGGGGTPLAAGIDMARQVAEAVAQQGRTPAIVLLTDGRANVARDPQNWPADAEADALAAGRILGALGHRSLLVDTSRRPKPRARTLAEAMGATYVPLPKADAQSITAAVQVNAR